MWRKLVFILVILLLAFPLSIPNQAQCVDTDGDGICDSRDACPNDRSNQCQDSDGDGVGDHEDQCPNERGVSSNNGCPAPDRDGDGVEDGQDRCPDTGGPSWNGGCPEGEGDTQPENPADGDGDGSPDGQDQCPNQAGIAAYNGCLPPLPDDGDCVAATNSNLRANIRQFPGLNATIVGQIDPEDLIPIREKIETPDSPFYLSENGWISGLVLRFAGDCEEVENPEPEPNCDETSREDCLVTVDPNPLSECGEVLGAVVLAGDGSVSIFDSEGEESSFMPYGTGFSGGISVATGDVNGDGVADIITGAGAGAAGGHVKVFDGATGAEIRSFLAFSPGFLGGVNVAAGDVNGDGRADIIVGAGPGAPGGHVKVFDGATGAQLSSFFAYDTGFTGGVRVAAGDVTGDGRADIITSPAGSAGPHVKVFDGATGAVVASFFAFSPGFTGGVNVAVGDLNGDCIADIAVGANAGGPPHVKVFSGADMSVLASFFAYPADFTDGVNVAVGDGNTDGSPDLITIAPTSTGGHVKVFDGLSFGLIASYLS